LKMRKLGRIMTVSRPSTGLILMMKRYFHSTSLLMLLLLETACMKLFIHHLRLLKRKIRMRKILTLSEMITRRLTKKKSGSGSSTMNFKKDLSITKR